MNLEKDFCALSHVYVRYYKNVDGRYNRETEFEEWMSEIESDYLEECFPSDSDFEIIDRFVENSPENIIQGKSIEGSFWYGVALRDDRRKIIGVCIFMGFDESILSLPEGILVTDEESLMDSIRFFTLLFAAQNDFESETDLIRDELDSVQSESSRNQLLLQEKSALSDILMKLESESDFTETAGEILEIAMKQLRFEEVSIIGTDIIDKRVNIISEKTLNETYRLRDSYLGLEKKNLPFFTGRPYTISSNSDMPSEFREFFDTMQIKAGGFFPLFIREEAQMYVQFVSFNDRAFEQSEIKFMTSVVRVLQAILTRRVTMNSLTGSYMTLEAILENAGCGMQVVDVEHGEVLYSNSVFKDMILNQHDKEHLEELLVSGELQTDAKTKFHATGADRWYDISFDSIKWVDGREARLYTLYDITLIREYQMKIEHQANTDYLTGLKNRKRFELDILSEIRRSERTGQNGALILIGLDDFNNINDTLGHAFGDDLLRKVAEVLEKIAAKAASVYRLGGDEFVLLVASGSGREIDSILHKVRQKFAERWFVGDKECYCTASVGVAYFPIKGDVGLDVFARADMALREAKKSGKNRVAFYNDAQKEKSNKRLSLEMALREAVQAGCEEFEVYYQPLVDISKEGFPCCGGEALLRWNSSRMGTMIMPVDFIPVAEHLGLILDLGYHVLLEAAKMCKHWNDFGHPEYKVNVNLSVSQLVQGNIVDTVEEVLKKTGVNPSNLTLEVTESLAIYDIENMTRILKELRKLGVRVALDDFGTGYSSLSYLKYLPLDVIKIDKSFVDEIGENSFSGAFIDTVSKLADALNANVVVEGVEKKEQADALTGMNIDMIQGYLYDKPLPASDFVKKYVN